MKDRDRKPDMFPIVGTTSSGKSTITEIYSQRFQGYPQVEVLEEGARIFFETNPVIADSPVHIYPVQERIQNFVLAREQAAVASGADLIISDRSVIDPVVLTQFYGDAAGADGLLDNVKYWLPSYDTFLLLDPTDVPYEEDKFRQETPEERLAIHTAFENFLGENNLPYKVISGSLEERVGKIDQIIFDRRTDNLVFDSARVRQQPI